MNNEQVKYAMRKLKDNVLPENFGKIPKLQNPNCAEEALRGEYEIINDEKVYKDGHVETIMRGTKDLPEKRT